jgi:hypothetical protein
MSTPCFGLWRIVVSRRANFGDGNHGFLGKRLSLFDFAEFPTSKERFLTPTELFFLFVRLKPLGKINRTARHNPDLPALRRQNYK